VAPTGTPPRTQSGTAPPLVASEQIASTSSYMRAIVDDSNEESLSDEERAMIERLRKLKFGTWFEFTGDDGATTKRIKLSWMSLLTSTCMFVDRSGMQAEIKTLGELAQEILSGRARVIPKQQHPFIERALVSVRKVLSQAEGGDDSRRPMPCSRSQPRSDLRGHPSASKPYSANHRFSLARWQPRHVRLSKKPPANSSGLARRSLRG
jgi:hypothetical protein